LHRIGVSSRFFQRIDRPHGDIAYLPRKKEKKKKHSILRPYFLRINCKYQEESDHFTSWLARLLVDGVSVSSRCVQNEQCLSHSLMQINIP
jgi:hypothetical protein